MFFPQGARFFLFNFNFCFLSNLSFFSHCLIMGDDIWATKLAVVLIVRRRRVPTHFCDFLSWPDPFLNFWIIFFPLRAWLFLVNFNLCFLSNLGFFSHCLILGDDIWASKLAVVLIVRRRGVPTHFSDFLSWPDPFLNFRIMFVFKRAWLFLFNFNLCFLSNLSFFSHCMIVGAYIWATKLTGVTIIVWRRVAIHLSLNSYMARALSEMLVNKLNFWGLTLEPLNRTLLLWLVGRVYHSHRKVRLSQVGWLLLGGAWAQLLGCALCSCPMWRRCKSRLHQEFSVLMDHVLQINQVLVALPHSFRESL